MNILQRIQRKHPARKAPRARRARRRGVAMLLVLIALGAATVLSGSYLMSRRTAPAIGANAETSSNAKWAAHSGANMGVAILETSYAVRGNVEDDQLVAGLEMGVGAADAILTGITGNAVTASDTRLVVTSVAAADSIGALSQRVVLRRPTDKVSQAFDPYLREFAVFATSRLRLEGGSYVAPWPDTARGPALFAANIGVAFAGSGQLTTTGSGPLFAARLYVDDSAAGSLEALIDSSTFGGGLATGVQFPTASARVPAALTAIGGGPNLNLWLLAATTTANRADYDVVTVTANCTLVLDQAVSQNYSMEDLTVTDRGTLRVKGDVRVYVRDDLEISDRANIEFHDAGSSIEFYVNDDVTVTNAVVGLSESHASNGSRTWSDFSGSYDASAVRIYLIDPDGGGDPAQNVTIGTRSILVADIHAPAATVSMSGNSIILGRLAGGDVRLQGTSIVFYDHALNPGAGLTDPYSPLYDDDRHSTVRQALATFNNAAGLSALPQHILDTFTAAGVNPDPTSAGPISATQPDPRDIGKVTMVPLRRGAARAIESGVASGSLASALFAEENSVLSGVLDTVGGLLGALGLGNGNANGNAGGNNGSNGNNGNGNNGNGGLGGILSGLLGGGGGP